MSIQLSLAYDTTSLDFQADGYKVKDGWYPVTATDLTTPVNEKFDVLIIADNHWELESKVRAIGLMLIQARTYPTGPHGVYLNFAMIENVDTWRSRITDGRVLWDQGLVRRWNRNRVVATVMLQRAPAWDGPEAQLPLSNPLATNNVTGLTVYNPSLHRYANTISFHGALVPNNAILDSANGLADFKTGMVIKVFGSASNDGTYTISDGGHPDYFVVSSTMTNESAGNYVGLDGPICNYVDIAGANAAGELPGQTRLEITNNYNSASRASNVWIGQNWNSDPANMVHTLQAEDAVSASPTNDASASGNKYVSASWSGTTEATLLTWNLTTALLNQLRGYYQRILIHFNGAPGANTWLRLTVYLDTVAIWTGPLVYLDQYSYIQELSSLRLPPYLLEAPDLYPLTIKLNAKHALSGAHSLGIDHIQITPLDGWRKLAAPMGENLAYQQRLVDDGIYDYLYADGGSPAGKAGYYVGYGDRIKIYPGVNQRLYFLHMNDTSSAPVVRTLSVKVFYRPRKVTL